MRDERRTLSLALIMATCCSSLRVCSSCIPADPAFSMCFSDDFSFLVDAIVLDSTRCTELGEGKLRRGVGVEDGEGGEKLERRKPIDIEICWC